MNPMRIRNNQKGVTLLESLLGILLFSVGILAVVGMQAMAVRNVAESKYRMDASFLANQIIGEMWVNRTNLASYAYTGGTPPAVATTWVTHVANTLPGTTTTLNPPLINISGNTVTITLRWQHPEEARMNPPPPPHNHQVIASIDCC